MAFVAGITISSLKTFITSEINDLIPGYSFCAAQRMSINILMLLLSFLI